MSRQKSVSGFSLIELLVVIAIASALTAIAVPQYVRYRSRAFDLRALEDLRNVAIAEEAYFADAEHYIACSDDECSAVPGIARLSEGVRLTITLNSEGFTGVSAHPKGSGRQFRWDSTEGGLLR